MKKIVLLGVMLVFAISCSVLDPVEITEDTAVAVVGGACKEGYKGPSGDPQVDVFCQAAWSAKCAGKTAELKANCDTYKSFKALNPNLPVCPYCN